MRNIFAAVLALMLFAFMPIKANAEDVSHDILFTGEISYDYLDYAKMSNVDYDGSVAFDDEYMYYTEFGSGAKYGYMEKGEETNYNSRIYKRRLDGTGEPIVILKETDELFYQKIHSISVSDGRVYFIAIPTEYGYEGGTDNFFSWLYSMDTDGNDLRIDLRDDAWRFYVTDGKMYYYREFLGDIESGFVEYDIKTEKFREVYDEFGTYSLVTEELVLFKQLKNDYNESSEFFTKIIDRKSGEVLFSKADISADFLFGDYLFNSSGELINIKTLETKDFVRLDEDSYISDMTVYKNKLYYFYMKRKRYEDESTKMLISYDFNTGQSLIVKVYFRDEITETEYFENTLYSLPNGVYTYTHDGYVTRIVN
jgi:hypothetical protein